MANYIVDASVVVEYLIDQAKLRAAVGEGIILKPLSDFK
jgi:hypothetical protein